MRGSLRSRGQEALLLAELAIFLIGDQGIGDLTKRFLDCAFVG